MHRLFLFVVMLTCIVAVEAQNVEDQFEVGPYDVEYNGVGDYNVRMKKGVDLYEFFGLKRDTIIQVPEQTPEPLKYGFQFCLSGETGTYRCTRFSMSCGLTGTWKQKVANKTYINCGLSIAYAAANMDNLKEDIIEFGIPLSIEWSNLNSSKASMYGGIGMSLFGFSTMSAKYIIATDGTIPNKYNGLLVAPQIDFGAYIPVGKKIIKIGLTWRYKINCSTQEYDLYRQIVGRSFVGANLGIIL